MSGVVTPDLQRIVEALKACREGYEIWGSPLGPLVQDLKERRMSYRGSEDACQQWIDARCAEAVVRAIREPSADMLSEAHGCEREGWPDEPGFCARHDDVWRAMCDAILGEHRL